MRFAPSSLAGRQFAIGSYLFAIVGLSIAVGLGQPHAEDLDLDFDTEPPQFFGDAQRRNEGGNPGGYVSVTDALNGQRGAIIFPPVDTGGAFSIGADLRVGGGTDRPADGFSFNFARPDDPVLDDGEDWASSPTGEGNLPEEGTTTGLAIGFDEWFSGGDDVVGMSVRIDNELVAQIEFPTLNGALDDLTSLQTGPLVDDGADPLDHLGWARLEISLDADSKLRITYKGLEVFNEVVAYEAGVGQLVFGGRTGGANGNHHIDNISIRTAGVVGGPPGGGPQLAGDCDQNGVRDISDLICNVKILFPGFLLLSREGAADPCVSGDGSVSVLDVNGDSVFNGSDALYLANFLFIGGPPPTQGEECFVTTGECAVSLGCE